MGEPPPDGQEELLELGPRRRRPAARRVAAVALLAAAVGGYVVLHGRGGSPDRRALPTVSPTASTAPTALPTPSTAAALPPWPQRPGACGNSAFLPLVTSRPLDRRTGARAVVGDRLATVDIDSGAVRTVAGLPAGEYATQIVTAGDGTYALLRPCDQMIGSPAEVVRVDPDGTSHPVARGPYSELVGGGAHPWAVIWDEIADRTTVDPLTGGRRLRLPADFSPLAGFGDYLVGTENRSGSPVFRIRGLDPRTGRVLLDLGAAASVTVSRGVVVWTDTGCTSCRLHAYDLATGHRTRTPRPVPVGAPAWDGVVSPDGRTIAFLHPAPTPGPYATDHPGNPTEIFTVDLVSGAAQAVPGLRLWSKANPGLDFSADSRWLLISVDEGSGTRLLLWRPGLSAVRLSPARLTTPVAYTPGLATVG